MPSTFNNFDAPLKELNDYDYYDLHRNLGRPPRWTFPTVIEGYGLRCVRMDFENFDQLWPILAEGDTTHIDRRYRERDLLYEQVLFLYRSLAYSAKHGACDWIIVQTDQAKDPPRAYDSIFGRGFIRLRENEQIVGVIHLYELNHERYDGGQPNPFVGLQIAAAHRRRGIGRRAMRLLEWYVANTYPAVSGLTADIKRSNTASLALFAALGFSVDTDEYSERDDDAFLTKVIEPVITALPDRQRDLRRRLSGFKREQVIDLAVKYAPDGLYEEALLQTLSPEERQMRFFDLENYLMGFDYDGAQDKKSARVRVAELGRLRVYTSYFPQGILELLPRVVRRLRTQMEAGVVYEAAVVSRFKTDWVVVVEEVLSALPVEERREVATSLKQVDIAGLGWS